MSVVDTSDISLAFFVTTAIFIFVILSCFSFGVVKLFQQRKKPAIVGFGSGIALIAVYAVLVVTWLADTM